MELSPLDAARKLAPQIRSSADEIEAAARAAAPALRGAGRCRPLPHGGPALHRRRRDRPADLHPGDRGARQGRRQHRLVHQPGRDLRDLRGAHAARHGARHLDRHAARGRREHAGPDRQGRRGAGRLSRHRPPGLQHRLPARLLGGRARADHRQRPGADSTTASPRRATVRAGRRSRAARHLARARHARHRHPSLRGERRLRAGRAHRALGDGAARGDRARSTSIPRTLLSPRATPRWRSALARTCLDDLHRAGRRQDPARHARPCCAISPWSRSTSARPRRGCAPAGPSSPRPSATSGARRARTARSRSISAPRCAWPPRTASALAAQIVDASTTPPAPPPSTRAIPIQRHFQDIHVITQHMQSRLAHYELVGRYWLGLPIDENRL